MPSGPLLPVALSWDTLRLANRWASLLEDWSGTSHAHWGSLTHPHLQVFLPGFEFPQKGILLLSTW